MKKERDIVKSGFNRRGIVAFIPFVVLLSVFLFQSDGRGQGLIDPLDYPFGTVKSPRPYILWQDIYNQRDRGVNVRYRLTVERENGTGSVPRVYSFMPQIYYRSVYLWRIPEPLQNGTYRYTVDRILDGAAMQSRHYHFRRYPVRKSFTIDTSIENELDDLRPEYLVQYIYLDRNNTLNNGYNALFFAGSSTVTLGIGIIFYTVIDLGVWSMVISAVCFTSSAVGYSAAGYYTWQYSKNRRKLQKILEIGKNTSIHGGIIDRTVTAGAELSF
jgi:hypothetical protein